MTAIIGWIGSVLAVSSILQKSQMRFRALNLAACVAMVSFNLANATGSMVLLNVVVAAINIRQIIIIRRTSVAPVSSAATAVEAPVADASSATVASEVVRPERELVAA